MQAKNCLRRVFKFPPLPIYGDDDIFVKLMHPVSFTVKIIFPEKCCCQKNDVGLSREKLLLTTVMLGDLFGRQAEKSCGVVVKNIPICFKDLKNEPWIGKISIPKRPEICL
jgi:hypothetical protein